MGVLLAGCSLDRRPDLEEDYEPITVDADPPPGPGPGGQMPPGPDNPGPGPDVDVDADADAGATPGTIRDGGGAPPGCDCAAGCTDPACEPPPPPRLVAGASCAADDECESNHCNAGICCAGGVCCRTVADCPAESAGMGAFCDNEVMCQGSRGMVTCEAFRCGTLSGVDDDSACSATTVADDCGPYPAIFCTGATSQVAPACPSACNDDGQCDEEAHCSDNRCVTDRDDGGSCESDGDCKSGHCQAGICCSDGDCCNEPADCPDTYGAAPICDRPSECQGSRREAVCEAHVCAMGPAVDDDSACTEDVLSNRCGFALDVYCRGGRTQSEPGCNLLCTSDRGCDDNAFCQSLLCQADRRDGLPCEHDGMCISGHCQNGFCCEAGDCCRLPSDCPGSYGEPPVCNNPTTCRGSRVPPVCDSDSTCQVGRITIRDDSGCAGMLANDCDVYPNIVCTGQTRQSPMCATSCSNDDGCDSGAVCFEGTCQDPAVVPEG